MRGNQTEMVAWLVAGLGYGDEGKGTAVDYITNRRRASVIVRYNGGAQAAHRVVLVDGREHVFSQFGSGMLNAGVLTHLSRFMLVEPIGMMREEEHLSGIGVPDAFGRTSIDAEAPLITPFHIAAGRIAEMARKDMRHGSCGLGIGETIEDLRRMGGAALFVGDIRAPQVFRKKLFDVRQRTREKVVDIMSQALSHAEFGKNMAIFEDPVTMSWCLERCNEFAARVRIVDRGYLKMLLNGRSPVFEGAQGMLLDRTHGFYPHITKTDITFTNARTLLDEAGYTGDICRVGVLRGYFTRHGAGPFVTEDADLTRTLQDPANIDHAWQGSFRVGHFDAVAARYAIKAIGGVDEVVFTNLDRLIGLSELKFADTYLLPKMCDGVCEELFEMHGSSVASDIRVAHVYDRARQTLLMERLRRARPQYVNVAAPICHRKDAVEYARILARELGRLNVTLSFGPTAEDKMVL